MVSHFQLIAPVNRVCPVILSTASENLAINASRCLVRHIFEISDASFLSSIVVQEGPKNYSYQND